MLKSLRKILGLNPLRVGLDHLARVTTQGDEVERVIAPSRIFLVPAHGIEIDSRSPHDFREDLSSLQSNTVLYEVYAQGETADSGSIHIGQLILRSQFIASRYGDEQLFFQHQR